MAKRFLDGSSIQSVLPDRYRIEMKVLVHGESHQLWGWDHCSDHHHRNKNLYACYYAIQSNQLHFVMTSRSLLSYACVWWKISFGKKIRPKSATHYAERSRTQISWWFIPPKNYLFLMMMVFWFNGNGKSAVIHCLWMQYRCMHPHTYTLISLSAFSRVSWPDHFPVSIYSTRKYTNHTATRWID